MREGARVYDGCCGRVRARAIPENPECPEHALPSNGLRHSGYPERGGV